MKFNKDTVSGQPKWIVPQIPKFGFQTLQQWRPYSPIARIKWQALLSLYRAGLIGHLPGVQSFGVSILCSSNWNHILWDCPMPPTFTAYIGTPGATRKAVVTLGQRTTGQPIAIIKVPLGIKSVESIAQEANALHSLGNSKYRVAPKLIHHDTNLGWSLQEAINGPSVAMRLTKSHYHFLGKLQKEFSFKTITEFAASLLNRMNQLSSLPLDERLILGQALQMIHEDTPVTTGWVHGDFAPWNLKWSGDNELVAVDWEFAETHAPIGMDIIHYLFRINYMTRSGSLSAKAFESRVIAGMKKFKTGFYPVHEEYLKQFVRYYLVWYQVVLEEHGIVDSTRLNYYRITRELFK